MKRKIRVLMALLFVFPILLDNLDTVFAMGNGANFGYIVQTEYDQRIVVENGIEFHYIADDTWQGVMAIIKDPSRVFIGMPREAYNGEPGKKLEEIATRYNALYAVNGGFFETSTDMNAGTPVGIVISEGKHCFGSLDKQEIILGITNTNTLVCDVMTGRQALEMGMRDALSCSPVLVSHGQIYPQQPTRMDARTAVGARADGSILILSIDGRMSHSLGASWLDAAECMLKFGAVNAGNIDGGGSSGIYYTGQASFGNMTNAYCRRKVPNAVCVRAW